MFRRWWIRRCLKWHGICPDHGTPYGCGFHGANICSECDAEWFANKNKKVKALIAELKEIDGN